LNTETEATNPVARAAELLVRLREEIGHAMVGQTAVVDQVIMALIASGHVLVEGVPGLGKTLLVRALAQALSLNHARVQFTPDLMPTDITGHAVLDPATHELRVVRGPVFTHLLLADEINRAPAKVQSAMLEVMAERHVSIGGRTFPMPDPFLVLATQNPIENEGVYPLPEAQRDRFLLRMSVGYPERSDEWRMLADRAERRTDDVQLSPVVDRDTLLAMQLACEDVFVSEPVGLYMVDVVAATRNAPSIQVGASPRGSLALLKLSRCRAALDGRDYVTPDDVKAVAVPALAHRLTLRPELWVQRISAEDVVRERLATVATPVAEDLART